MKNSILLFLTFTPLIIFSQDVILNEDRLVLRSAPDFNHSLEWKSTLNGSHVDGPFLKGWSGGALGTSYGGDKSAITWRSNGNVGIGVPLPTTRLDVNGNVKVDGEMDVSGFLNLETGINIDSDGYFSLGKNTNTNGYLQIHQPSYNNTIHNTYIDFTENLYFRRITDRPGQSPQNRGALLGLDHGGSGVVTIGIWEKYDGSTVSNPEGHKLMVNGSIVCQKLKVIVDVPNSDHVFGADYKLASLKDVESFILENKHLPEVPSAAEFKENGYSVGEMDDLLLRKVEELTLYIIALENKMEELNKKVENK